MTGMLVYAVESSICLALLWGFHEIALKRDTRHRRNRYYLTGSMLFSMIIPLITIKINVADTFLSHRDIAAILLPEVHVLAPGTTTASQEMAGIWSLIYLTGVIITAAGLIAAAAGLVKMAMTGSRQGRVIYCDTPRHVCYSAFGYIFISKSVADDDAVRMINHERNHITRLHHVDLIIAGLVEVIQWFNPAAHLLRRSLQAIHEYDADSSCLAGGEEPLSYQQLLLSSALSTHTRLMSNSFSNNSLLKNRIKMMTKKKSGRLTSLKMLLALPLAFTLVFLFSCRERGTAQKETGKETVTKTETVVYDTVSPSSNDKIYSKADVMPQFQNDSTGTALMHWLAANIKYPDEAKQKGIQGKVMVRFVIDEEGNVTDPVIVKSADPLLDQAAYDVINKCPKWSAGLSGGKPVKVYFTVPIIFNLQ
jgi:TonB family protein